MRHRVTGKTLGRDAAHRKALLKNLSGSLIVHESVTTTLVKAKYVQPYVEKLITSARENPSFSKRRLLIAKLNDETASRKLFSELGKRFADRKGGYTRITKIGERGGDNAPMARIELVDAKPTQETTAKPEVKEKKEKKEEAKVQEAPVVDAVAPKITKEKKVVQKKAHTGVRKKG